MNEIVKNFVASDFTLLKTYGNYCWVVLCTGYTHTPIVIEVITDVDASFFHKTTMTIKVQEALKNSIWKEWYKNDIDVCADCAYNFKKDFIDPLSIFIDKNLSIKSKNNWLLFTPYFGDWHFNPNIDKKINLRQIVASGLLQIAHLQKHLPGFRHNDIVFSNWVIMDQTVHCKLSEDFSLNPECEKSFQNVYFFDFGLTSDNNNKLDFAEVQAAQHMALLGINDEPNPIYDAHLFLTTIYNAIRSKLDNNYTEEEKCFFAFVERHFKQSYLNSVDSFAHLGISNRYDLTIQFKMDQLPPHMHTRKLDGSALLIGQRLNRLVPDQVLKKRQYDSLFDSIDRIYNDNYPPMPTRFGMKNWHDCNHILNPSVNVFDLLNDKYICSEQPQPGIPLYKNTN